MTQENQDRLRIDPYADEELVPFDVRDYSGKRAMWMLIGLIVLALIAALIIFNLYQPGTRDRDAPPQISADNTPYKVEPEDRQGEVTPNQDKEIYDAMNGNTSTDEVTNRIDVEEPIKMPDSATVIVEGQDAEAQEPEVKTPEPVKVEEQPVKRPEPVVRQPVIASGSSDYVVQVASVRTEADAQRIWNGVQSKFSGIMPSGSTSDVKRVDLGDKGIYYRLRVIGLADQDAAKRLCDAMKSRDQACFVTRR